MSSEVTTSGPNIDWRDEYITGIEEIDRDHRLLFLLLAEVNTLAEMGMTSELGHVVDQLASYVESHFAREENIFQTSNYPGTEDHVTQHAILGEKVGAFVGECFLEPDMQHIRKLQTFLADWLINHIIKDDMAYVPWLKVNRPDLMVKHSS